MANVLERASRVALELLFPPQCALCGHGGTLLCGLCLTGLEPAEGKRCGRCWVPVVDADECRHCADSPPAYATLRSGFVMQGDARRLAHQLKYDGLTSLAAPMAAALADAADVPSVDVVAPVPLHRARERSRGYNQAAVLAGELASLLGVPVQRNAAQRIRATAPLVKAMSREERLEIVRGAFRGHNERVEGCRVLLIDDVATTGATLSSCAAAMLEAGALSVDCLTWARAD